MLLNLNNGLGIFFKCFDILDPLPPANIINQLFVINNLYFLTKTNLNAISF